MTSSSTGGYSEFPIALSWNRIVIIGREKEDNAAADSARTDV